MGVVGGEEHHPASPHVGNNGISQTQQYKVQRTHHGIIADGPSNGYSLPWIATVGILLEIIKDVQYIFMNKALYKHSKLEQEGMLLGGRNLELEQGNVFLKTQ